MNQGFTLRDRFVERERPVLLTGVQALVRMMLLQAEADRAAGMRTGGFVTGYRGSPLGTLDTAFAAVKDLTAERGIVVKPGVNEELAATAIAGSQQVERSPKPKVDGVFSLWYGKGPGVERAADAIRHGNSQGTSPHGGVLMAVGDDHLAKSSSVTCYSDGIVSALNVPLLYPADAADVIHFGLHGFAMSRLSGSWVGIKIVPEVADATFSVSPHPLPLPITLPQVQVPSIGLHNRWPEMPLEQEMRQHDYRLPAIAAYMAANPLYRVINRTAASRIGVIAAGKSWNDVQEALRLLGVNAAELERLGIALFKPAMIWPMQSATLEFARGLEEVIVVEEKGPFYENQLRAALYGDKAAPAIYGKSGPDGTPLLKSIADLNPELIARALGAVLARRPEAATFAEVVKRLPPLGAALQLEQPVEVIRKPFFCSGCPHNRSTVVPEGSRALGGIGCHGLATYNRPRTGTFAQMGGEGVHWMGAAPFTEDQHVFANMGDGTYFHSGLLAIRQAVAARLNITYKLLYNSAVAMTGGQQVDGELSVEQMARQLRAEGVDHITIATDDPGRYPQGSSLRSLVNRIEHRDELERLQLELRADKGVSVIIYEQMCATEKRRLRKRGRLPDPTARILINQSVCEGCGDCSVKSNCLSVEPVDTPFGVKRRINQSSCNKDYSCADGFCPSFVRVEGGKPRAAKPVATAAQTFPQPLMPQRQHERLIAAGIGGTGVVTIGALLSTAAHLRGARAGVLDQVGMAQKGGAVASHIHVVQGSGEPITALRLPAGQADLLLACDEVVANSPDVFASIDPGCTKVLANSDVAITGDFTQNRDALPNNSFLAERLRRRAGDDHFESLPFGNLAQRLLGDAIGANLMMVGYAYQKGWLNLDEASLMQAIDLNGQAVTMNKAAFNFGRQLVCDRQAVYRAAGLIASQPESLDALLARFTTFLTAYQNQAYADRFSLRIKAVAEAEQRVSPGSTALTEAAARSLFKLMAYKDEYEVARLYSSEEFANSVTEQFDGKVRLSFYMAPPILSRRDPVSGHLRKRSFGPWLIHALRIVAKLKGLRGTAFDVFGFSGERKLERKLVQEFDLLLASIANELTAQRLAWALDVVRLPMDVRGYGHVKLAAIEVYAGKLKTLLATKPAAQAEPQQVATALQR